MTDSKIKIGPFRLAVNGISAGAAVLLMIAGLIVYIVIVGVLLAIFANNLAGIATGQHDVPIFLWTTVVGLILIGLFTSQSSD